MIKQKLFFKVICEHNFSPIHGTFSFSYGISSFRSAVKGWNYPVPKYKHHTIYRMVVTDCCNKKLQAIFGIISTHNKKEAFELHKIFKDLKYALLNIKSTNENLRRASEWKIYICPNIPIKIHHVYKNKIPKKYLIKRTNNDN